MYNKVDLYALRRTENCFKKVSLHIFNNTKAKRPSKTGEPYIKLRGSKEKVSTTIHRVEFNEFNRKKYSYNDDDGKWTRWPFESRTH